MKMSLNWLNDYIDVSDFRPKLEELSRILTQAGLEVEGMTDQKAQFNNVVIGKLINYDKHPNADKLTQCQVDTGDGSPRQIVCGAKNHKAGDYVVAALPGAVLPGDFAIKKSKIRDVESLGMLCSTKELGLVGDADGIIVMKEGRPGQSFAEAFGFNDVVFELNVTPNRADCLSHRGLANELAALLDRPMKSTAVQLKTGNFKTTEGSKVSLQATDKCPRYAGRMVKGVKIGPSPNWLKQRLEAVGLRPINNVVDVTNYVMFDFGQPLHAFDWSQVKGGEIIIRNSQKGEKFQTLDGTELALTGEELVIADKERAVALGGVVGGLNSGVTEATQDLFIESAFFNSQAVRRTSRRFGFETDSSYRFSRGVNPEQTVMALDKACELITQVAGGEIAKDHHDIYPKPLSKTSIPVTVDYVSSRLGYSVDEKDFSAVMKRLGCEVKADGKKLQVTTPLHRWDLRIPEDLVEEYGRVHGYDHLKEILPPLIDDPTNHVPSYMATRKVAQVLAGEGLHQAVNYAFLNKAHQEKVIKVAGYKEIGIEGAEPIAVKNPITEDFAIMRMSLLPSLVTNISHNYRHGNLQGQIFEIGAAQFKQGGQVQEKPRLGFAIWGDHNELWAQKVPPVYRLKTLVENLLQVYSPQRKWQWKTLDSALGVLHPKQTIQLMWQGQPAGVLGSLHPQWVKELKLRSDAALCELDFERITGTKPSVRFQPIPAFPGVEKDLAFVMPKSLKANDVEKGIAKAAGNILQSVKAFDVYEGAPLKEDQRSVAFKLNFQSNDRTLADEEVQKLVNSVIEAVSKQFSIQLR